MAPFHHHQGLVDICWLFAWGPSEGPPLPLATSKLGDLEGEEFTFQWKETSALDLIQKIKEEART